MRMYDPPHPGALLKDEVLPSLRLSVTEAAAQLGVSRVQLSRFINGRASITPELALRLGKWIPAPTPISWLEMQADYDLWQLEHSGRDLHVAPAHAA